MGLCPPLLYNASTAYTFMRDDRAAWVVVYAVKKQRGVGRILEPEQDVSRKPTRRVRVKVAQQKMRTMLGVAAAILVCAVAMVFSVAPVHAGQSSAAAYQAQGKSGPAPAPDLAGAAAKAAEAYTAKIHGNYQMPFGAGDPFLPSNATSATGGFIDPKLFPTAEYCEHCHQATYQQWRQSAHANSFRTPWYVNNVNLLIHQKGVAFSRHCEGCHNPIALMSGALTQDSKIDRTHFDQDGVTCMTCHAIQRVDARGTGSYVMGVPAVLLDAAGKPILGPVSDAEILAHLDRHDAAVMKPFYRTSEMCSACHEAALPHELNGYKWQRAFSVYDEWQLSSFAKQSPLPAYVKDHVSNCQTCHMTRVALTVPDSGGKAGMIASHRWLGANTVLPTYYGYSEQLEKTIAFLRNGALNVDIFGLEKGSSDQAGSPNMIAPLGTAPFSVEPGNIVTVSVVIQNKGIGHSQVPEQRDMYQSWVEFLAKDANGAVLDHSGFLQPDGKLDPRAHSFTNRLIDALGSLNDLHQVWNTRVVAYNNTVQSGRSQLVRYQFRIPPTAKFPISVTASVKYRRFKQSFIDFGVGRHYVEPVVEMASQTRMLQDGANVATPPSAGENPEWMRWNNFGIALLDAQQYGPSARAFEAVAKLQPTYADAYTNVAVADFQWQRYDDARVNLQKALQLSPESARAYYYLALVERNQGNLDAAIADLEKVTAQFPLSRDAHRELGFSYYQQHKYAEASEQYQKVQAIAPDDLAAHYILSIVYRRLHMEAKAREEAVIFADQKDDPAASAAAFDYLSKHPEVAAESVPWHTHVAPNVAQKEDVTPQQTAGK